MTIATAMIASALSWSELYDNSSYIIVIICNLLSSVTSDDRFTHMYAVCRLLREFLLFGVSALKVVDPILGPI